jgi:hypothetical protein
MSIVSNITRNAGRLSLKAQSASPRVLFAAGIVGVGATVVLACRATLKVEDVLDGHDKSMVVAQTKSEVRHVYLGTSLQLLKLYSPALVCGVVTVGALAGSHNILSKRNAGLTAAYGALDKAFKEYRERIANEIGSDRERELYEGVEVCEIEDASGKKVKKSIATGTGAYKFFFDENNPCFEKMDEYNLIFLKQQQIYANQKLQAKGHVFLNEVLEALGFEHTPAGAVTGWVYNTATGDDFIDFGIFNKDYDEKIHAFMIGEESGIWLDFNVDGVIYDKI